MALSDIIQIACHVEGTQGTTRYTNSEESLFSVSQSTSQENVCCDTRVQRLQSSFEGKKQRAPTKMLPSQGQQEVRH